MYKKKHPSVSVGYKIRLLAFFYPFSSYLLKLLNHFKAKQQICAQDAWIHRPEQMPDITCGIRKILMSSNRKCAMLSGCGESIQWHSCREKMPIRLPQFIIYVWSELIFMHSLMICKKTLYTFLLRVQASPIHRCSNCFLSSSLILHGCNHISRSPACTASCIKVSLKHAAFTFCTGTLTNSSGC